MVLAYISIEGWIVHPDVNSFFYGSDEVLVLPPYNAKIFSCTDNSSRTSSTTPDTGTTSEDLNNSRSTSPTTTEVKSYSKWVINMSKKPLTEPQVKLLAHGPNYVVTPRNPPIGEYITAVEKTCLNLIQGEADELRAEIKAAIKRSHPPRPNITREEQRTLRGLKKDDIRGNPHC